MKEIVEIVIGIIVSLGGGGAIVLGFSSYLGQLLAKRYEEKIKAKFQNEINEYQSQLDIIKRTTNRYLDKQFEHYSKLWSSLHDLKLLGDELWKQATSTKLERFSKQLKSTRTEIEKASLFINDDHYTDLMEIIRHFSEYQVGKSNLINFRQSDHFDLDSVEQMIANNEREKKRFENLILKVRSNLKQQIGGN